MNNTEKLLRAFIKASGYEIERLRTGDVRCDCYKSNPSSQSFLSGCHKCQGTGVTHGLYDYKLTKRPSSYIKCNKCGTHLSYNSPLDACLCGNSNNLERVG
jgi:hypothetical protein